MRDCLPYRVVKPVKNLIFHSTDLQTNNIKLLTISWMLEEDTRLLDQGQSTLLLTAIAVAWVLSFSCTGSQVPFPTG